MNALYIVPDINKVSGGPRTRISLFKETFLINNDIVIEKGQKASKSFALSKINMIYVESASNRIGLIDIFCLIALGFRAKKRIVFIRDIYIELFPEEYKGSRAKITRYFNKASNFYLTLFATNMVFPTRNMGNIFFKKNKKYPKRPFSDLPPGTPNKIENRETPDFTKKLGILYLGSTRYKNSGFDIFLDFAQKFRDDYNFFVLSGDDNLEEYIKNRAIEISTLKRDEISTYLEKNNIAYALHTRPRNDYDDITFPIKILDFINLKLPFFSEPHTPLQNLLGKSYELFHSLQNLSTLHSKIQNIDKTQYKTYSKRLEILSKENTYENRFKRLLQI